MSLTTISSRTVGQYPISIATSLALEGVFGIHPDRPVNPPPIQEIEELWINIRTLFRNLIGSLDKGIDSNFSIDDLSLAIEEEMSLIEGIINDETNGRVKVVYYYCNYDKLERRFKHAVIRVANTDKQKVYLEIANQTTKDLLTKLEKNNTHDFRIFSIDIHPNNSKRTAIITNYAIDLLSKDNFKSLVLLESHTGKLKTYPSWYTKFSSDKNLVNIPFNVLFIQIFGDAETFRPFDVKVRKEIIELASRYQWTCKTTAAKVRFCIDGMKNQFAREIVRSMMNESGYH